MPELNSIIMFAVVAAIYQNLWHPLILFPNTLFFIMDIIYLNKFIEYTSLNYLNPALYCFICIIFVYGILLYIQKNARFYIKFMQLFIYLLFAAGTILLLLNCPIGWIFIIYVGILLLQILFISIYNCKKDNWYIKIILFPGINYVGMSLFIKSDKLKQLRKEQDYDAIHLISKNKIDSFIKNLKRGYYITDTNLIILKKMGKIDNIKIIRYFGLINLIGENKFKSTIKRIYGNLNNKYAELKINTGEFYFYVVHFKIIN